MIKVKTINSARCAINDIVSEEMKRSKDNNRKVIFIVPETSKYAVERVVFDNLLRDGSGEKKVEGYRFKDGDKKKIAEYMITAGLVDVDVISFYRLADRIIKSRGISHKQTTDELLLRNVIYRILLLHGDEFRTINKLVKRFEYIDMIIRLLGDFTRYGVDENDLEEVVNSRKNDEPFYDKVHDIGLLIRYIKEVDAEFGYTLLESSLEKAILILKQYKSDKSLADNRLYATVKDFSNIDVVIYGFGSVRSFTPQETDFVQALSAIGTEVHIYSLYDKENEEGDLFYFGNQLLENLRTRGIVGAIDELALPDEEDSILREISSAYSKDETVRIVTSDSEYETIKNDLISKGMADRINLVKMQKDSSVNLIKLNDCDDLLSYVCNEIIRLTREENYRYRDIRVFSPDEAMTERFKGILHLFNLDAFIDRKIVLNTTPIMRYVETLLELPLHGFPTDDVLRLLRTGLAPVSPELVDYFENFCKANNILFEDKIFDKERYEVRVVPDKKTNYFQMYVNNKIIENGGMYLYGSIVEGVLVPLKQVIDDITKADTIAKKSIVLMTHLDSLTGYIKKLGNKYLEGEYADTDSASAIVRSYKEVMGLLSSFANDANEINISLEQFAELIKIDIRNKVIGTIPLTVDSIEIVDESSACYTPCKVMFMIGCNSSNFPHKSSSEGIMSNSELDKLGREITVDLPNKAMMQSKEETVRASLIVNAATEKIYMMCLENDFESSVVRYFREALGINKVSCKAFKTPIYGDPVARRHDFLDASIPSSIIKELLENKGSVSVSSLEKYNKCALQYMLDNLLKIRERADETSVKTNLFGTLVHDMFEHSIGDIVKEYPTIDKLQEYSDSLTDDKLTDLANQYFDKARLNSDSPDRNLPIFEMLPGIKVKRIFKRALPILIKYCIDNKYVPTYFERKVDKLPVPFKVTTANGLEFYFRGSIDRVDVSEEDKSIRIVDYKTGDKEIKMKEFLAGIQIQLFAYALAERNQGKEVVVDNVGYIKAELNPSDGDEERFRYESSSLDKDGINAAIDHVKFLINKSCEDIASGRSDARVNSMAKDACTYCAFKGLCGNDGSIKVKRVVNTDLPEDEFDKDKHKKGNSYTMKYYVDVMKRNEKDD